MKKLVVYYSLGGNTRRVAAKIASEFRADIIELQTVKDYPDDYDVLLSLGQREVQSGYIPELKPMDIDYESYDGIFIGTPVWWGSYAPAMRTSLSSKFWGGKHVYPFVTHDGKIGRTSSELKRVFKKAILEPQLNVKFDGKTQVTPEETVDEWILQMKKNEKLGR